MVKDYTYAYILYAVIVYFIGMIMRRTNIKYRNTNILLLVIICTGALIAALRPENTQDTEIYNFVYERSLTDISSVEVFDLKTLFGNRMFYNIELFYIFLMSIFRRVFRTPVFFYFAQGIVSNIAMIYALFLLCEYTFDLNTIREKRYFIRKRIIQLYSFYIIFCGILYTSSAIRDGLSISIGLVAIGNLLLNRKKIFSVILIILSILIHTTSIILIPIYILLKIWKFKISKSCLYLLCVIIPILYLTKIGYYSVHVITDLVANILQLFNIQAFYSYITNLDFQLPMREGWILFLTCIILPLLYVNDKKREKLLSIVLCGLFMFVFAYPIPALARLLYIFILFLFPIAIERVKYANIIGSLIFLYIVPQFIYVFGYL